MKDKRDKKLIIVCTIMMVFSSIVTVYAASYLFESEQVSYDNTSSGLTSTNVQDSLDELYNHATDYTEIKSYFQNNPTSYFDGNYIKTKLKNGATSGGYYVYNSSDVNRSSFYFSEADNRTRVTANDANGTWGKGIVDLRGSSVEVNGVDITQLYSIGNMSTISSNNIALHNCTGSVRNNAISYKIAGNSLIIAGRLEISITTRTGANPGASITIPSSRKLASALNVHTGGVASYSDGPRNGESTVINGTAGDTTFLLVTSETHSNVSSSKVLVLFVPTTAIPLQ